MKLTILKGFTALSEFRINSLINKIKSFDSSMSISDVETFFVYLLEIDDELTNNELQMTLSLLEAKEIKQNIENDEFIILPRKGTISPWSSKAEEIFIRCGISKVKRIERGICYILRDKSNIPISSYSLEKILHLFYDRMIEGVYKDFTNFFIHESPKELKYADILNDGKIALIKMNIEQGLALSNDEIDYLYDNYNLMKRNPTDVELVMFGQVNSEHCRHKIFNGEWIIDGERKQKTLFQMIKNTHEISPEKTLVAYNDNSSVIEGVKAKWFESDILNNNEYSYKEENIDILCKVETHNHPTAISPYPGAATGVGGEIRDEGATGIGSKSKAGLSAFMVSNLNIPGYLMPWEKNYSEFPKHLAKPLLIMLEGPIGGARFGNEFGRPQLCGIFKTFEEKVNDEYYGYHKPIMVAGGMGNIKRKHINKKKMEKGTYVIQLGGPALKIGIGGGAASSMDAGKNALDLDFNSVQRDNAEMQRRCQEVINACIAMEDNNPIVSIHDVGAGGLSNACPELVSESGGEFWLRKIFNQEPSMTPMEIWCCEAQERYVLGIDEKNLKFFLEIAFRENCPAKVIGKVTGNGHLTLNDDYFNNNPIDIDLKVILGKPPKLLKNVKRFNTTFENCNFNNLSIGEAIKRVLSLPSVANKTFLITIADRSITGMVARDQMVGPFQLPLSDVAVTSASFENYSGEAMSMGEKTNIAVINAKASGRMAVGEALTNIAAASIDELSNIKLSANWMAACGEDKEDINLFDTVEAISMELCPKLKISIPVGKDSLSMRTVWNTENKKEEMKAPLSLVISAFSPVKDIRKTLTPDIKDESSKLFLIDLGKNKNRLGGSALAQVYNKTFNETPDFEDTEIFISFFKMIQELIKYNLILSYHDRSDGGMITTIIEMCFGGKKGALINLNKESSEVISFLFSEELGAIIQVSRKNEEKVLEIINKYNLNEIVKEIGEICDDYNLTIKNFEEIIYEKELIELQRIWSELTYRMQSLRDNPKCAKEEYDNILNKENTGIKIKFNFNPDEIFNIGGKLPKIAILREQGINGHIEMAAAFEKAKFLPIDVHMNDLIYKNKTLDDFCGIVACGGFSYGDVLGAGSGWAKSIIFNSYLKDMFEAFFNRSNTFSLGICNGCQMLSQLKEIIPGARNWPYFIKNKSEQFEARLISVKVLKSPSIFFKDMIDSVLPIPVAHGEGYADFTKTGNINSAIIDNLITLKYVDNNGKECERYPYNPNGSPYGITGLTTPDGRTTIMMPHPERVFRAVQLSYKPSTYNFEMSPWMKMFQNARRFIN